MNDALSKLQGVPGFDNVLYFGFGYESFVRVIASSQLGVNCVVLCSALSETHSDEVAAWTLAALWEILLFPAHYQPSQTQFLALIRACSGVLTSTTFSQTADMMLGDRRHTKMGYWGTQNRAESPDSLAKVLNALFRISRREAEGIKVFGGWECAFVAAMSYWLFNFTTQVFDEDGLQVFTSTDDDRSAQVVIFYQRDGTVLSNDLQLSSMTYIFETTSKMWRYDEEEIKRYLIFRVDWGNCLNRVFGSRAVQGLSDAKLCVGEFMGSVSRIYKALAQAESDVSGLSRSSFIDFFECSYGQGYISSVERLFPELTQVPGLRELMLKHSIASISEAEKGIEIALQNL